MFDTDHKETDDKDISEFKGGSDSEELKKYCLRMFNKYYESTIAIRDETEQLWDAYNNKIKYDYMGTAFTETEKKLLMNSLVFGYIIDQRISLVQEQKPRVYINPEFKEGAEEKMMQAIQANLLPPWFLEEIKKMGGDMSAWFNSTCDVLFDDWWEQQHLPEKIELLIKWAYFAGAGFWKLRRKYSDNPSIKDIVIELVPSSNVAGDPVSMGRDSRRCLMNWKDEHIREIEQEFELKKGSVRADKHISQEDPRCAGKEDLPDDVKYAFPQARVVEAIFRDRTKQEDGSAKYPNGRLIVFLTNQDDDNGVTILRDDPYEYSQWQPFGYCPKPQSETDGKPIGRDLLPTDALITLFVQQAAINQRVNNGTLFVDEDKMPDADRSGNTIANVQRIKDYDPNSSRYYQPGQVAAPALQMASFLIDQVKNSGGIQDAAMGRRPGDIESGKAISSLQQAVTRGVNTDLRQLYGTLADTAVMWMEMVLEVVGKDHLLRTGPGFRKWRRLPFALYAFVSGATAHVGADTKLRMDPEAIVTFMTNFRPDNPFAEALLKFLPDEISEDIRPVLLKYNAQQQQIAQLEQQLQQMQQQLQQVGSAHEQMGKEMQGLQQENQGMKMKEMAGAAKHQQDMEKKQVEIPVTLEREDRRQIGKLKDTALRGEIQIELERMRSASNKKQGQGVG